MIVGVLCVECVGGVGCLLLGVRGWMLAVGC